MSGNIKIIFGVPYSAREFEGVLDEYGVKDLDTGASYPGSEQSIGDNNLPAKYTIHTKTNGWAPGALAYDAVLASAARSLDRLGVKNVETYYLHSPDPSTPFSETLSAIQKLYEQGIFKHFGLSNFLPADVQAIYDHCHTHAYVLPTVYEGHYSPLTRHCENTLLPLLRSLNIRYNAYGCVAGGFLTKSPDFFTSSTSSATTGTRWDSNTAVGKLYNGLYNKPSFMEALRVWEIISREEGVPQAELAYRWVVYHSALNAQMGDGIVVGAGTPEQLRGTLEGLKRGPLGQSVVGRIEKLWGLVRDEAVMDNYNGVKKA